MKSERHGLSSFVVFLSALLLLATLAGCGRKGEPVLITPDEKVAAENSFNNSQEDENSK